MFHVRPIAEGELSLFAAVDGTDGRGLAETTDARWQRGASRPGWCFVLEAAGRPIARVGYDVSPTVPDPSLLGRLPASELSLFGLHLPWEGPWLAAGQELIGTSLAGIAHELPDRLDVRTNREVDAHPERRRALFDVLGMELFQEKEGYLWEDTGQTIVPPARLRFRSLEQIGEAAFVQVFGAVVEGTLDRNDRWYWDRTGPNRWARVMLGYLGAGDDATWCVGYDSEGGPVGMIAVSAFDEADTATITFVGVLPGQRGKGYIDELLAAGNAAARTRGFGSILSDVDTENHPMRAAMERAGHHPGRRPWHIWHHRAAVARLAAGRSV
ncbi:MAG: GNAT family N-acetyltransferase [Acidimicrobiales bacterium]